MCDTFPSEKLGHIDKANPLEHKERTEVENYCNKDGNDEVTL